MKENIYEIITDKLVGDGYAIVEDALDTSLCLELLGFSKSQINFKKAGIGNNKNIHLDSKKRSDAILWLDADSDVQSSYLEFTNGLQNYLNRTLYLGLSYFESHFSIYEEGDFYEKHLDAFKDSKNRVISTVYYLNDDWEEGDGGELVIYDEDHKFLIKLSPKANTLVIFLSEKFPHEVLVAKKKRYSIAGWFR